MPERPSRGLRLMLLTSTVTVLAVMALVSYTSPRLQYISEQERAPSFYLVDSDETSPKSQSRASMNIPAVKTTKNQAPEKIVLNSSVNSTSPKRDKGNQLAKDILPKPPDNKPSNVRFSEPSKKTRNHNVVSTVKTKYPASVTASSLNNERLTSTNKKPESNYRQQQIKLDLNNQSTTTGLNEIILMKTRPKSEPKTAKVNTDDKQEIPRVKTKGQTSIVQKREQTIRPTTPLMKQNNLTKPSMEMNLQNSVPQKNRQTVRPTQKTVEQKIPAPQNMKMNISGSQPSKPQTNRETFASGQTVKTGQNQPPVALSGSGTQQTKSRVMYLIYLCDKHRSCGGWGDRQGGILNAYLMSLVTGRRFGINMTHPCDIKLFLVPNKINWYVKFSELKGLSWEVVDWMDNPRLVDEDTKINFNKKYTSDIVFLRNNQGVAHRVLRSPVYAGKIPKDFQMNFDELLKKSWYLLMKLSIHMEERLDLFMRKVPKSGNLLCAHVRMRRNPTIPNDGAPINSLSSLSSLWNFLSLSVHKPVSRIFIATDSEEVRMEARKRFGSKELDTDGLIRHVDRQGAWSNACLGFEMVILDQLILSRCDILVRSTSHFSHKASILSLKNHKVFIFQNGTINESVI